MNLGTIVTFGGGLTWVITRRTRLESTPSHPRHPGGHDLFLKPSGLSLFVLIDLALEGLDLGRPFSETGRVRFGYIVCPSTGGSIHEEEEQRAVEWWRMVNARIPTFPERSNLVMAANPKRCSPPVSALLLRGTQRHQRSSFISHCGCSPADRDRLTCQNWLHSVDHVFGDTGAELHAVASRANGITLLLGIIPQPGGPQPRFATHPLLTTE